MQMGKRKPQKTSFTQRMQALAEEYMREHSVDSFDLDGVAVWACNSRRYQRQPTSMVAQCKRELADALRVKHYVDPQGRDVRKYHPVRIHEKDTQMVIWADIESAKPQHMRLSLSQSRQSISAFCIAHNTIAESYRDNNRYGINFELFDYNFNPDIAEKKLPTEYPDDAPEGESQEE